MTTQLQITKEGIKLVCDVDKRPRPTPRAAWPLPSFPDPVGGSLLDLTLERIQQTGRMGIRITSHGTLPGGAEAVWTLLHHAYQGGTPPATPVWDETSVKGPTFSMLLDQALPKAVHTFKLRKVEAGQTTVYPQSQISTPDDAVASLTLESILADDLVSAGEKSAFKAFYDSLLGEQAGLDALADQWLVSRSAFDAAVAAVVASVAGWSPVYTDLTHDTQLAVGGGATLLGQFRTVYSTRDALRAAISQAIANGTGDVWSDDKLTAAEKITVKAWFDDTITEQTGTNGLDTQADKAGVSRTTYDTAITQLEAWLDGLTGTDGWNPATNVWRTTATYNLGTGGGATGRSKFAAVTAARIALVAAINATITGNDYLTGPQKLIVKADRDRWNNDFYTAVTGLKQRAINAGLAWATLDGYIVALDTWLATLTSADGWNNATKDWKSTNTVYLGSGGGATLRSKIKLITDEWARLAGAIDNVLSTAALAALAAAPAVMAALVALPNGSYPTDKLVWLSTDWTDAAGIVGPVGQVWPKALYRSAGTSWQRASVTAAMILDQLVAGQISAGAIGATALAADLILASIIRSTGYTAGTSSAAPAGFKLSGNIFTTTFIGGATANVNMELGSEANFGGYKVATVNDRVFTPYNRINNPLFFNSVDPWLRNSDTTTFPDDATWSTSSATALSGSMYLFAGQNQTTNASRLQYFMAMTPDNSTPIYLTLKSGVKGRANGTASVVVKFHNLSTGVTTTLSGTWGSTDNTETVTWTSRTSTVDVRPLLVSSGLGYYAVQIDMQAHGINVASAYGACYVDEVNLTI